MSLPRVGKRPQTVVAVYPETKEGRKALEALEKAAKELKNTTIERIPFEKLDFGETPVLDQFYSANVVVADVTEKSYQATIFYHLGLRENFDMKHNVVTCVDEQSAYRAGRRSSVNPSAVAVQGGVPVLPGLVSCAWFTYVPYFVDKEGNCLSNEGAAGGDILAQQTSPLSKRLKQVLRDMHLQYRKNHKEMFFKHLRQVRETKKGEELKKELQLLRGWVDDDPKLFTADVILSLLLSYRDIQDYNSMVKLVEHLPASHEQTLKAPVQVQYAFALNRRNEAGDRDKALAILEKVLVLKENHVPDYLCLCGRIYKDKFVESGHTESEARDKAIHWYRKGFEVQPNEYAGINLATLLVISGQDFGNSPELRNIGMTLNMLIGRKGSLELQEDYWTVATFFEISVLAENYPKACAAAEYMFKLKPPLWYLKSTSGNIQLINSFRSLDFDKPEEKLFAFWMEFFIDASKEEFTNTTFPVLLYEPHPQTRNEFLNIPSYVTFHSQQGENEAKVQIWHCIADSKPGVPHEWSYNLSCVRNVSITKRDARGLFLYVVSKFSEDFHIFFSSEPQSKRFHDLVSEAMSQDTVPRPTVGEGPEDVLEYEYEYEEGTDNKVVLGRGSFGTVYSAIDVVTKKKMAVKEIKESDSGQFQSLQEEIQLHKHLQHKNIVQYYGATSEEGVFKIFMENVPGGSLSSLLKYKWGALKDDEATIKHYTRQVVEGLKYLHDQKIVHRDIKGDNVLVNMYSGQLKISDFGTSKRLVGLHHLTTSFKGTMQFMAPEVIVSGQRGYGPPADIWSLGCTVVEMATGRPPFFELGTPEAAIFKVGKYQQHPDIPDSLSDEAHTFLLRCFEPDSEKRATVDELLEHPFLLKTKKKVKIQIAPELQRSKSAVPSSITSPVDDDVKSPPAYTVPQ